MSSHTDVDRFIGLNRRRLQDEGIPESAARDFAARNPGHQAGTTDIGRVFEALGPDYGDDDPDPTDNDPNPPRRDPPNTPFNPQPRGLDPATTQRMMDEITNSLQRINAQPDVDVSHLSVNDIPVINVPGENLSPAIDDTLLDLMEGQDPFGITGLITSLMDRSAGGGVNSARLQQRQEAARENLTRGSQGALEELRAILADRGLIGQPGAPEGAELSATTRAFEPLQRAYLSELRTSEVEESERADNREIQALQMATGWTKDQVERRLSAAQTGQARQQMMADIALRQLDQNIYWNKFLAEFGLKREEVAEEMRQGRITQIQPVLAMFNSLLSQLRGGFI